MQYSQLLAYLAANELRLLLGVYLIAILAGFYMHKKSWLFSIIGGVLVTLLQMVLCSNIAILSIECLIIATISWQHLQKKINICLFLAFFYEVCVSLWDFLVAAGLGVLLHTKEFIQTDTVQHLAAIGLVRLLILLIVLLCAKRQNAYDRNMRFISCITILGFFGVITLSQQSILSLNEDQIGTWIILSTILLFAILFYRLNRQREMEWEISQLKQEKTEILERDYQTLSRTYAANAKLYHDLHNHIEAIYQCLTQGELKEALAYCEELRTPIREISQTVWTGDKAIDYLINSKMALAEQKQIETKINIEYPHNTNIRSVDLATILGNLLDNALEAAATAPEPLRFLHLTIRRINAMLIIKVKNGYGNAPVENNGKLETSKTDTASHHGWGLKSVQTAADRYDGAITINYQNGVFQAVVSLSFQPIKTK